MNFGREDSIAYLQTVMSGNKLLGLVAQLEFEKWVASRAESVRNKYFPGGWLVALKREDFYSLRTCFFVSPEIVRETEVRDIVKNLEGSAQFHRLGSSLRGAGFESMHCFGVASDSRPQIDSINWRVFHYRNERLEEIDQRAYFGRWTGRGRASKGRTWERATLTYAGQLDEASLSRLVMPQLFYNGFFKSIYRAATADPYDVDGFIVSYDGKVFPVELKEKFPFDHQLVGKALGIDVGRILMLLRICLPVNSNAMYIIREVDDSSSRNFIGWKSVYLDEILMKSSWQQMGGGPGMASSAGGAGSPTSTIIMPHHIFNHLTDETLSDDELRRHATLTESTKKLAGEFVEKSKSAFGFQ